MRKLMLSFVIALSSSAAFAEESAWPRTISIYGIDGSGQPVAAVPAVKAPAATVNAWTADFASFSDWRALPVGADAGGQHATPVAELDAQQRAYRAYWLRRHRELTAGGEWAGVLPVRIHERLNAQAFGSPVMGSQGGQ
jgi:hypothetical protein